MQIQIKHQWKSQKFIITSIIIKPLAKKEGYLLREQRLDIKEKLCLCKTEKIVLAKTVTTVAL